MATKSVLDTRNGKKYSVEVYTASYEDKRIYCALDLNNNLLRVGKYNGQWTYTDTARPLAIIRPDGNMTSVPVQQGKLKIKDFPRKFVDFTNIQKA